MDKVTKLAWKNYKGLPEQGEIDLQNGSSLILTGPNGAGKTSIVQIFGMLSRTDESQEPLKHGTDSGYCEFTVLKDGSEWAVKRVFNQAGRDSYLVKQDGAPAKVDGKRLVPNKKWFKNFFNAPSFDPLGLVGKKMKDLVDALFEIGGYDGSQHDKKIAESYQKRHKVGQEKTMKEGFIAELNLEPEDILKYKERVDIGNLSIEIAEAKQHGEKIYSKQVELKRTEMEMDEKRETLRRKKEELDRLMKEIEKITVEGKMLKEKSLEQKAKLASMEGNVPDVEGMQERFDSAQKHNEMVLKVESYNKVRDELDEVTARWKELDDKVIEAREEKMEAIMQLSFPDPNLFISASLKDEKVEYEVRYRLEDGQDVPFRQGDMNTAKLIQVGVQLNMKILKDKGQFPMMRLDCSSLDETTIDEVVDMLAHEGIFGVLEKAVGRQGVDTLQYKLLGQPVDTGSLADVANDEQHQYPLLSAGVDPVDPENVVVTKKTGDLIEVVQPNDVSFGDVDVTKMFDQEDEPF